MLTLRSCEQFESSLVLLTKNEGKAATTQGHEEGYEMGTLEKKKRTLGEF